MKISQCEARRLKKRVDELERLHERMTASWVVDYPGIHLGKQTGERGWLDGRIEGSRMLGRAVVVVPDKIGGMDFYAVKSLELAP